MAGTYPCGELWKAATGRKQRTPLFGNEPTPSECFTEFWRKVLKKKPAANVYRRIMAQDIVVTLHY